MRALRCYRRRRISPLPLVRRVPRFHRLWLALAAQRHRHFLQVNPSTHERSLNVYGRGIGCAVAVSYVLEVKRLG